MKKRLKSQKGITMIILTVAIIVLILVSNILIYNAKDEVYIKHLENMYADIESLRDKVIEYYIQYEALPANTKVEYSLDNKDDLKENWMSAEELENKFYVIDLKALENVSLNYGRDYDKIDSSMSTATISKLEDLYIVSEVSQNVYYVKGINVDGKKYYSDREKDETVIDLYYNEEDNGVTLADAIRGENYGDYIDYNVDLNDDGDTTNDWRIFYNDGTNVFLIAANYLPNDKLPEGTIAEPAVAAVSTPGFEPVRTKYGTIWDFRKLKGSIADIADAVANKFLINGYREKYKDVVNEAGSLTAEMLNTNIWKKFAVMDGAEAIASPTLEMFVKSWNEKGYVKLKCENVTEDGYNVELAEPKEEEDELFTAMEESPGMNDTLYFMEDPETYVDGYFIASPHAEMGSTLYISKGEFGLWYGYGENMLEGGFRCYRN